MKISLKRLPLGPYQTNCYLLWSTETSEGIVVDPSAEPDQILKASQGITLRTILLTHTHFDHFQALPAIQEALRIPLAAHPQASQEASITVDLPLKDGDPLSLGSEEGQILHTPGHTPDSLCLWVDRILIAGDTLFPGGPGKTASFAAFEQILQSIEQKIFSLPDDTVIYPGHGLEITVGQAKVEYAVFQEKKRTAPVYGDVQWLTS